MSLSFEDELQDMLEMPQSTPQQLRRRAEEINYWRQRAGWFDDDASMKSYNNGVYDTYYQLDDDARARNNGKSGSGGRSGTRSNNNEMVKDVLKVLSVLVAAALIVCMFRAIMRRMSASKKEKKRTPSDSRSRSGRSKSRTRSRSRSRKPGDYNLMEEEDAKSSRSKRSTRSKSRSKSGRRTSRSRSRSRPRSRSKTRAEKETAPPPAEPVLV